MKRWISCLLLFACTAFAVRAADYYGITDPHMAEYEGFWTAKNGAKGRLTAQIRPLANNQYDGFVLLLRADSPVAAFILHATAAENGAIKFPAAPSAKESSQGDLLAHSEAACELREGKLSGTFKGDFGEGALEASKTARKSPTLGATPPKGAVILLSESGPAGWEGMPWTDMGNGVLQVAKGNIKTAQKLSDYQLHLEFRTPYMPIARGQARGNSGVYIQGKYEVQVLDSFGLYPLQDNDCSGIYKVRAPEVNATLPSMEWQTYDITYRSGAGSQPATIHVSLNGITALDNVPIPAALAEKGTGGGDPSAGFLMLQDHGNPVQYRNIWAQPLK